MMPETLYEVVVEVEERVLLVQESCQLKLDTPIVTGNTGEKVGGVRGGEGKVEGVRGGHRKFSVVWYAFQSPCLPWSLECMNSVSLLWNFLSLQLHVWQSLDREKLKRDLQQLLDQGIRSLAVVLMHSYT